MSIDKERFEECDGSTAPPYPLIRLFQFPLCDSSSVLLNLLFL